MLEQKTVCKQNTSKYGGRQAALATAEAAARLCFQCQRCSAVCPRRQAMGEANATIIHWLQLGEEEAALASRAPLACSGCRACSAACPHGLDPAGIMAALRAAMLTAVR